jgi:hypothetical protein
VNVTLPDAIEQPDDVLSSVIATVSLDVAEALAEYVPRSLPAEGAELAEMVLEVVPAAEAGDAAANVAPATSNAEAAPRARILEHAKRTSPNLE